MTRKDLVGMEFERWKVVGSATKPRHFACICVCGTKRDVFSGSLLSGKSRSCGCLSAELTKKREKIHGLCGTKEYRVWSSMIDRAHHYSSSHSFYYQERGIVVCDRWLISFENFLEDMGICPEGLTLERVDNKLGYFPENCRWDTRSQQSSNRRPSRANKSGRIGVYWREDQQKWRVSIKVDKVRYNVGQFSDFEQAFRACTEAEIKILGYSREDN